MKTLYLMRHGEAAAGSPSGRDHDRPLTPRGTGEAQDAALALSEAGLFPDLMLVSNAVRTEETAAAVAGVLGLSQDQLRTLPGLYLAPPDVLVSAVLSHAGNADSVMVVAHNPGLYELASDLSGHDDRIGGFPTAGITVFELEDWDALLAARARLIFTRSGS